MDVPIPQIQEQIDDVVKVIASQRVLERTVEQIVDVPVTKISKDTVEMIQSVPKEQIQEHIGEETMDEMPEVDQTGLSRTTSSAHRGKTIEVPASSSLLLDSTERNFNPRRRCGCTLVTKMRGQSLRS